MNGFEIQCIPGMETPALVETGPQAGAYPNQDWFFDAVGAIPSDSGVRVNPVTAIQHGPVWQAVNILAGDVGQLPFHVMRQRGRMREKFTEHPVDWLIHHEPNPTQTASQWKETMMAWALLWGNACCYIERGSNGRPEALIPLMPDITEPTWSTYEYRGKQFEFPVIETWIGDQRRLFLYSDIFHIAGLATDGFWGVSAVEICKNDVGHGMALTRYANRLFKNGATPSGVLEHPGKLSPEARANLREEWYALHGGLDNALRTAVLAEGMKFTPISMSSQDAEYMEDKKFDREMVASLFNLPAFKLNALENSAVRANLEEQNRDYFNTSLSRWLNKFREEGERKLLGYTERREMPRRGRVYLRWFPEAFLRGDTKSRFEAYSLAITGRFMSPNEVREKEDMNPYDGGDEFLNPAIEQSQPSDDTPTDDQQQGEQREVALKLMRLQCQALLEAEASLLEKSVTTHKPRNYLNWCENLYASYEKMAGNFLEMPTDLAVRAGYCWADWRDAASRHAGRSLQRILEITEQVTKEELQEPILLYAAQVRKQRDGLTNSVLGE